MPDSSEHLPGPQSSDVQPAPNTSPSAWVESPRSSLAEDEPEGESRAGFAPFQGAAPFPLLGDLMSEAMILVGPHGEVQHANERVKRLTGLTASMLVRDYGLRYTLSNTAGELTRAQLPLARALQGETVRGAEFHLHLPDREIIITTNAAPVYDAHGNRSGALLVFEDITRRALAERRQELLAELTDLLADEDPGPAIFEKVTRMTGEVMGAWTVMALVQPGQPNLEGVGSFHPVVTLDEQLRAALRELRIPRATDPGMGYVSRTGKSILLTDLSPLPRMSQVDRRIIELFAQFGSSSLIIVPLEARETILGVLMLVSLPRRSRFTEADLEYTQQLVGRIAVHLDNARLVAELKAQRERLHMLSELTRQFSSTLELQQVLRTVAAHVANAFGDWCTLGLYDEANQTLRPVVSYHRLSVRQPMLDRLMDPAISKASHALPMRALTQHAPLMLSALQTSVSSPDKSLQTLLEHWEGLQPEVYLCVPLVAPGRTLGYLEVVSSHDSAQPLKESAVELIHEICDRASTAIHNARLYEELHEQIQAKDDWLSVASHELKTPLTPLQLSLDLMWRRIHRGQPIGAEQIERAIGQVRTLIQLINELLDASRMELGQLQLHREPVNLKGVVEQVVQKLATTAPAHMLRLDCEDGSYQVLGDGARLEQMVQSLVHNAIKYSPEGGPVNLVLAHTLLRDRPGHVLVVEDRGVGIPSRDMPRLFQRYFRASNVSERNYGGLGLGLWMTRELTLGHGGTLTADSTEGQGSRFYLSLPDAHQQQRSLPRPTVMLLVQQGSLLASALTALEQAGCEVLMVHDANAAQPLITRQKLAAIVLDLTFSRGTLLEVLRTERATQGHLIPALIGVGIGLEAAGLARELDAAAFVPLTPDFVPLVQAVQQVLGSDTLKLNP